MQNVGTITLNVETGDAIVKVKAMTEALNALAEAAERARLAVARVAGGSGFGAGPTTWGGAGGGGGC